MVCTEEQEDCLQTTKINMNQDQLGQDFPSSLLCALYKGTFALFKGRNSSKSKDYQQSIKGSA